MLDKLKELVNDEQMINDDNRNAQLKVGKLTISAGVVEGNDLEKVLDEDIDMVR